MLEKILNRLGYFKSGPYPGRNYVWVSRSWFEGIVQDYKFLEKGHICDATKVCQSHADKCQDVINKMERTPL